MPLKGHPHEHSRLAKFVDRRILDLAPKKAQRDIALEAGFRNVNMISMIKSGSAKLALDRVPARLRRLRRIRSTCLSWHWSRPASRPLARPWSISLRPWSPTTRLTGSRNSGTRQMAPIRGSTGAPGPPFVGSLNRAGFAGGSNS